MTSPSKSVDSLSKIITQRRARRRGTTRPTRLFLEELESRCVLSGGALAPEQAAGQSINALGQDLYSLRASRGSCLTAESISSPSTFSADGSYSRCVRVASRRT
jgi:hypothetical protein